MQVRPAMTHKIGRCTYAMHSSWPYDELCLLVQTYESLITINDRQPKKVGASGSVLEPDWDGLLWYLRSKHPKAAAKNLAKAEYTRAWVRVLDKELPADVVEPPANAPCT